MIKILYAAIIILVLLAAALALSLVCYKMAFVVPDQSNEDVHKTLSGSQYDALKSEINTLIDEALALPFEEVKITSFDGLKLYGRLYFVSETAPVDILFHGYKSMAIRDFSGGMISNIDRGHNVILVDERAHGKSEGKCLTFGVLERYDCLEWARYASLRFPKSDIFLFGLSMGAATVLMASDLNLPESVVGIVADCGYSTPKKIIKKVIREMKLPPDLAYPFVWLGGRIFGNFSLSSSDSLRSLKNTKLPVLLIHGDDDRFVPYEMSLENKEACASEISLLTVKNAGHGLSYLVDKEAYISAVDAFCEKHQKHKE